MREVVSNPHCKIQKSQGLCSFLVSGVLVGNLGRTRDTAQHPFEDNVPGWVLSILEMDKAAEYLQYTCEDSVVSEVGAHMYIMRSKNDIGIRSVVAAKISSAKGYSSSSSFPWPACCDAVGP